MAEKFLKVIIDGQTNYVPDTTGTRKFWAKQNANIGKGRNSDHHLATVLPATAEETAFMHSPELPGKIPVPTSIATEEIAELRRRFDEQQQLMNSQQQLINQLLAAQLPAAQQPNAPVSISDHNTISTQWVEGQQEKELEPAKQSTNTRKTSKNGESTEASPQA